MLVKITLTAFLTFIICLIVSHVTKQEDCYEGAVETVCAIIGLASLFVCLVSLYLWIWYI